MTVSLAFEVGHGGDLHGALAMLDAAEADVSDADLAQLSNQRGVLNYRFGRLDAAVADLTSAHDLAALTGDWRTDLMALVNLGAIQSQRAEYEDARERLHEAITLAAEVGQPSAGAVALANLAYVRRARATSPKHSTPSPPPRTATGKRGRSASCRDCTPTTRSRSPTPTCSTTPSS